MSEHRLRARDPLSASATGPIVDADTPRGLVASTLAEAQRDQTKFTADPARYIVSPPHGRGPAAAGEVLWTCPMHPQIVRKEPGNCPICGMTLEPMTPAAGDAVSPELRDITRRFWVGVALSVPLLAIAMADHFNKAALDAL